VFLGGARLQRRKFITLLSAAAVWPASAVARQSAMPVIGFAHPWAPDTTQDVLSAFRQGLGDTGSVEGKNVAIEYRWTDGHNDRWPAVIADLVGLQVSVLAVLGSTAGALAAKAATQAIPIVFLQGADPVRIGLVSSLNHPGGNVTGISLFIAEVSAKRFRLLLELAPSARQIGYLYNPSNPVIAASETKEIEAAANALAVRLLAVPATNAVEIDRAFDQFVEGRADALFVGGDGFFLGQIAHIADLAASRRLPAVYGFREAAESGGLLGYGANIPKAFQEAGVYAGRIVNGEKPSDMPVTQPTSLELTINLKAAQALGLTVPVALIALANQVIE
jgi:putative ABC transport system substrate-binding protein